MPKKTTFVWHVSPVSRLYVLRPSGKQGQSAPMGMAGIYVAPKFRDAVMWFLSYVAHKKSRNSRGRRNLCYQQATIYKIAVPQDVLKDTANFANWWEPEYFIPESEIKQIQIVSHSGNSPRFK